MAIFLVHNDGEWQRGRSYMVSVAIQSTVHNGLCTISSYPPFHDLKFYNYPLPRV